MNPPSTPLSEEELDELQLFLVRELDSEDGMSLEMADGFLHAIALGPSTVLPEQWLPKVWGTQEMVPPMDSAEQTDRMLGLVLRHFHSIVNGLDSHPRRINPFWSTMTYAGSPQEYEDAEAWAYGFVQGMKLCWSDWQPFLSTPQGKAMFRPIGLLGEDGYSRDQDDAIRTPAMRDVLAQQIPQSLLDMHAYLLVMRLRALQPDAPWLPVQPKVGRNEPCPCGSGKKFKKCCGAV